MKIIENGDVRRWNCIYCLSLLEVSKEDVKDDDQLGYVFKCPVCGKWVPVSASAIPRSWGVVES